MLLRDATEADIPAITAIANEAIANTTANWSDAPISVAEQLEWFATRTAAGYPVLVADVAGEVAGYASYGQFRPKVGYRSCMENSVYINPEFHGQGIGKALLELLLERARTAGVHTVVASVEAGNLASIRLHEKFGFAEVGRFPQIGEKFGRWLDCVFLQVTLDDREGPTR